MKKAYFDLRTNAKRRGKDFSLTFDQFESFCSKTSYIDNRGRAKEAFSIDRIDVSKGYEIGNIQVLTNSQNSIKYHQQDRFNPFTNKMACSSAPF